MQISSLHSLACLSPSRLRSLALPRTRPLWRRVVCYATNRLQTSPFHARACLPPNRLQISPPPSLCAPIVASKSDSPNAGKLGKLCALIVCKLRPSTPVCKSFANSAPPLPRMLAAWSFAKFALPRPWSHVICYAPNHLQTSPFHARIPVKSMQNPTNILPKSNQNQNKIFAKSKQNPCKIQATSLQNLCKTPAKSLQKTSKLLSKSLQNLCKILAKPSQNACKLLAISL